MTRKELKRLLREVIREELAMLTPGALSMRSERDQCDKQEHEDQYVSTKTNETASGEYKSPAQRARELQRRLRQKDLQRSLRNTTEVK